MEGVIMSLIAIAMCVTYFVISYLKNEKKSKYLFVRACVSFIAVLAYYDLMRTSSILALRVLHTVAFTCILIGASLTIAFYIKSLWIMLPECSRMETYLRSVDISLRLETHFYPQLLQHAGRRISARSFATIFNDALETYSKKTAPRNMEELYGRIPDYLSALIKDPMTLEAVKRRLNN